MSNFSRFLIGAASSGSGKTTVTSAIMRALSRRGIKVAPFKCGPDYIDTKYHHLAAGFSSYNLDLFFSQSEDLNRLFMSVIKEIAANSVGQESQKSGNNSPIAAVCEGVMGLFDGFSERNGSSADVAIALSLPVILVVNAKSMAHSVAPLLKGFKEYDKRLNICGVIFNFVNTESHFRILKAAADEVGIACFGRMPFDQSLSVPSRHLGLNFDSDVLYTNYLDSIADLAERHIDIDALLEATKCQIFVDEDLISIDQVQKGELPTIAIANDEAFCFIYPQTIRLFSQFANIVYFSPLNDKRVPECDLLYLPGGYPELHAQRLQDASEMKESIRNYVERGGAVLAECGGMMFLTNMLVLKESSKETNSVISYEMCGVLNLDSSMVTPKLTMGYRQGEIAGHPFKGHEFHYSSCSVNQQVENDSTDEAQKSKNYMIFTARGDSCKTEIYRYKNLLASYIHFYWNSSNEAQQFLAQIMSK